MKTKQPKFAVGDIVEYESRRTVRRVVTNVRRIKFSDGSVAFKYALLGGDSDFYKGETGGLGLKLVDKLTRKEIGPRRVKSCRS